VSAALLFYSLLLLFLPAEPELINIFNFILFNYTEVYCFRRADALFSPIFRVKLRTNSIGVRGRGSRRVQEMQFYKL